MRVLVAEDDPVIALGLCERLRALGHDPVGPAADGEQAIELARTSLPDLYLSSSCRTSTGSMRRPTSSATACAVPSSSSQASTTRA